MDQHFRTTDGVKLHYVDYNCTDEPLGTLIILHGWVQSAKQWKEVASHLADLRVILLDHRGHGESEKVEYGYRLSRLAKDLDELIAHLSLEKVHIMGHSASVSVILNYIDLFGCDKIASLVLVDHFVCAIKRSEWGQEECRQYGVHSTAQQVYQTIERIRTDDMYFRETLQGMFSSNFSRLNEIMDEAMRVPVEGRAQMLWSSRSGDVRDILPRVSVPTLCITGGERKSANRPMVWMASQIPKGDCVVIPNGSHFMFLEDETKDDFVKLIRMFLPHKSTVLAHLERPKRETSIEASLVPDDSLMAFL